MLCQPPSPALFTGFVLDDLSSPPLHFSAPPFDSLGPVAKRRRTSVLSRSSSVTSLLPVRKSKSVRSATTTALSMSMSMSMSISVSLLPTPSLSSPSSPTTSSCKSAPANSILPLSPPLIPYTPAPPPSTRRQWPPSNKPLLDLFALPAALPQSPLPTSRPRPRARPPLSLPLHPKQQRQTPNRLHKPRNIPKYTYAHHGKATEIVPGLYVSDLAFAESSACLAKHGITHILSTISSCVNLPTLPHPTHKIQHLQIPIDDTPFSELVVHLPITTAFISTALRSSPSARVLVHCAEGISRSVSVVAAYLIKERGWHSAKALAYVKRRRSVADPNFGFVLQLAEYAKEVGVMMKEEGEGEENDDYGVDDYLEEDGEQMEIDFVRMVEVVQDDTSGEDC